MLTGNIRNRIDEVHLVDNGILYMSQLFEPSFTDNLGVVV